ncbi:MAG: cupin domain-containing protein [Pseudomonadota bacterium]
MSDSETRPYQVERIETAWESADLLVRLFTLDAGQEVPWHYHSAVADIFVGLEGVVVVETRAPRTRRLLHPGEHCQVAPKTAHRVSGLDGARCRFALTQGVGDYDFVRIGGDT